MSVIPCPACGMPLPAEGEFRKCGQCHADLAWVEGHPCEPGQEAQLLELIRQREADEHRKAEYWKLTRAALYKSLPIAIGMLGLVVVAVVVFGMHIFPWLVVLLLGGALWVKRYNNNVKKNS